MLRLPLLIMRLLGGFPYPSNFSTDKEQILRCKMSWKKMESYIWRYYSNLMVTVFFTMSIYTVINVFKTGKDHGRKYTLNTIMIANTIMEAVTRPICLIYFIRYSFDLFRVLVSTLIAIDGVTERVSTPSRKNRVNKVLIYVFFTSSVILFSCATLRTCLHFTGFQLTETINFFIFSLVKYCICMIYSSTIDNLGDIYSTLKKDLTQQLINQTKTSSKTRARKYS